MFTLVEKYQLGWSHSKRHGWIKLFLKNSAPNEVGPLAYEDYSSMVDMLRNEKPIYYDDKAHLLATHHEWTGEGEK